MMLQCSIIIKIIYRYYSIYGYDVKFILDGRKHTINWLVSCHHYYHHFSERSPVQSSTISMSSVGHRISESKELEIFLRTTITDYIGITKSPASLTSLPNNPAYVFALTFHFQRFYINNHFYIQVYLVGKLTNVYWQLSVGFL